MILGLLLLAGVATTGGDAFAAPTRDYVVQASQCIPNGNTAQWVHDNFAYFGLWSAVPAAVTCPANIPDAARVLALECAVRDATASGDIIIQLIENRVDGLTGAPGNGIPVATVSSSGSAGYQMATHVFSPPVTLFRRNGDDRSVYTLIVNMPPADSATAAFRECAIVYQAGVPQTVSEASTSEGESRD